MAFGHGKNVEVFANGYDLTGYFDSVDQGGTAKTAETTTFGSTAETFVAGVKNGSLSAEGYFDGSANAVDAVLSSALAGTVNWLWWPQGDALGNYGYGMAALETSYGIKGSISAAVRVAVASQSNVGIERVRSIHPLASEAASGNSAAQDDGMASANGGSAYIECTAATGTLACIVEHSTDNVTFTTLASFTSITAANKSERISFTGTVNRYVRAKWTITGGPSTFIIGIHRN